MLNIKWDDDEKYEATENEFRDEIAMKIKEDYLKNGMITDHPYEDIEQKNFDESYSIGFKKEYDKSYVEGYQNGYERAFKTVIRKYLVKNKPLKELISVLRRF